jgi:hypothetical protein
MVTERLVFMDLGFVLPQAIFYFLFELRRDFLIWIWKDWNDLENYGIKVALYLVFSACPYGTVEERN